MAILTVLNVTIAGVTPAPVAAGAGGDSFLNTGQQIFHVINGGGSACSVQAVASGVDNFGISTGNDPAAISVPAGQQRFMGPYPTNRFNDANNRIQITYSQVASVTVEALDC